VTGFVPDIRPYMAQASVYIVPLRLGVGIRGKILEAWAMGMPVVASPVACAGLRFEHDRNLLVAESPHQFATAAISLLRDAARRDRLGREGRHTAEAYYSWEASASQLARLYAGLISGRGLR
jgi:glycosyltransferase involved in cell wall biosynthesis